MDRKREAARARIRALVRENTREVLDCVADMVTHEAQRPAWELNEGVQEFAYRVRRIIDAMRQEE